MLLTIALILFILWLLGAVTATTLHGLFWLLLVVALILFIVDTIHRLQDRR